MIDDGSKDNSGRICEEYAKNDKRIRVFHKENGGVSSARNLGLDNANCEWIYFSDADNVVDKLGLKILMEYTSDEVDLITAGFKIFSEIGIFKYSTSSKKISELISPSQALIDMHCPMNGYYQGYL